jgi:STE24 endopeptidase
MSLSNPWFLAALIGVLGLFHLDLLTALLNSARLGRPLPPELDEVYSDETRERLRDYLPEKQRLALLERAAGLALLLGVWWSGGFGHLQQRAAVLAAEFGGGPVLTGVIVLAVAGLVLSLLALPFEIWDTFGIEARQGFNRTTPGTFVSDQIKGLLLSALLGLPVAAAVVALFETQARAPLLAWLFLAGVSLLMTWLSPRLILPLFLKFRPLEDGPLRQAVLELAAKLQFPVADVSVVDGSRRSSKANAFFTGFGRTRRIALYDTLLEKHPPEEILAVLAHEIGHWRLRHVPRQIALGLAELGLQLALLGWALNSPGFFAAFGVTHPSAGIGLLLAGVVFRPINRLTSLAGLALSRRHEFQADAYAAKSTDGAALAAALKRLSADQLAHPQPHELTVVLGYSHPPLLERLRALAA